MGRLFCNECGSEESLVKHLNKIYCKNCHAAVHGQILRFSHPTLEIIEEIRIQGKSFDFIANHLGITRQQVYRIRKGLNGG